SDRSRIGANRGRSCFPSGSGFHYGPLACPQSRCWRNDMADDEVDADLAAALKLAKSRKMFFAFVPKGTDGTLIVSRVKIPPKLIADAKKELGGAKPVMGQCFGPLGDLVFQVAKKAPSTMAATLRKVVKRDAGLTIVPDIQVGTDEDE